MTAAAITMMVVTMLIIWGGLIAAIVALKLLPVPNGKHEPDQPGEAPAPPAEG